jgi:TPR repeat protein
VFKGWVTNDQADGPAYLKRAAELGDPAGQCEYGVFLSFDRSFSPDVAKLGVTFLQRAADAGNARAYGMLGVAYSNGFGGLHNDPAIVQGLLQRSFAGGYYPALRNLSELAASEGNQAEAHRLLEQAAEYGDDDAMGSLLSSELDGGADTAKDRVRSLLQRGALWENRTISRMYACNLLLGRFGLTPNDSLAVELLRFDAAGGDNDAKALLAAGRVLGLWGITQAPQRAQRELARCSEIELDGTGLPAYVFGRALYEGTGLSKDESLGLKLIRHASALHFPPAKAWLDHFDSGQATQPTSRPAPSNSQNENAQHLRQTPEWLTAALIEAGGAAALKPHDQPSPAKPLSAAAQMFDDDDACSDWWYANWRSPSNAAIARMIDRARTNPFDASAMGWAAILRLTRATTILNLQDAHTFIHRASDLGNPTAMSVYGNMLVFGIGVPRDTLTGLQLLRAAMDRGEPVAVVYLGTAFLAGPPGLPRDLHKAVDYLREAAARGTPRGLAPLAKAYEELGQLPAAAEFYERAAAAGDRPAMILLTRVARGQIRPEFSDAYKTPELWQSLLLPGTLWAIPQVEAAAALYLTDPLHSDPHLALLLLRRARRNGSTEAAAVLANSLVTGDYGVVADPQDGIARLEQLAAGGPTTAPVNDIGEQQEAAFGQAEAKWRLGRLLLDGRHVQRDEQRGKMLIESSAAGGNPDAKCWLASDTDKGRK